MNENIYKAPESQLIEDQDRGNIEVWNPDVAGAWSLLFTPIFGSIIVYKNWQSIGDLEQAQNSKKWIYISVVFVLISLVGGFVGFIYLVTWYFMSQKKQTLYLKDNFRGDYTKKAWIKPLGIAFGISVIAIIIISLIFLALGYA